MNNLLYTIAVILVVLWAVGYFAYGASSLIHLLLVIAVLFRIIQGRRI